MRRADVLSPERRLRRMRAAAGGLLLLLALLFVIASILARRAPAFGYLRAFAEAGLVGGCADWFAVTALFRRPLGLPIPHTALVPREKERIGAALGEFIAENFLTAEVLDARLRRMEMAQWGAAWLRDPANASRLADHLARLTGELMDQSTPQARRDFLAAVVRGGATLVPAAPAAARLLRALWADGACQLFIDRALREAPGWLSSNEEAVRGEVAKRSFRWLPRWVDRKIGDQVIKALADMVEEMRAPDHPWRDQADAWVAEFVDRLEHDVDLRAAAERLKQEILGHPLLVRCAEDIGAGLETRLRPRGEQAEDALTAALAALVIALGDWLNDNPGALDIFNAWARLAARRVLAPRRHQIGAFIAEVVAGWDTRGVVEKLELRVGPDLQYIRINGALVGGLAGLAIFAAARLLGL